MKKILAVLCTLFMLAACHNAGRQKYYTFESAQADFEATITAADSAAVKAATDEIMSLLQAGQLDDALSKVYVVYEDVLYRPADESLVNLKSKFKYFPVLSYEMTQMDFQTPAINDVTYRYVFAQSPDGSDPAAIKLAFNPVKIDGEWYITFKDGNMTSRTMQQKYQKNPMAPAPNEVRLPEKPAAND
ncbi:MAG: hypothetical protein Q4B16_04725 [Bacteroidia bacterium]|nr:hypothetical protein [Bacteroidia bacterium]